MWSDWGGEVRLKTGGEKVTSPNNISGKQAISKQSAASVDTVDGIKIPPLSDCDAQMMIMMVVVIFMTAMVNM